MLEASNLNVNLGGYINLSFTIAYAGNLDANLWRYFMNFS
jgi:hypothetical protein